MKGRPSTTGLRVLSAIAAGCETSANVYAHLERQYSRELVSATLSYLRTRGRIVAFGERRGERTRQMMTRYAVTLEVV